MLGAKPWSWQSTCSYPLGVILLCLCVSVCGVALDYIETRLERERECISEAGGFDMSLSVRSRTQGHETGLKEVTCLLFINQLLPFKPGTLEF